MWSDEGFFFVCQLKAKRAGYRPPSPSHRLAPTKVKSHACRVHLSRFDWDSLGMVGGELAFPSHIRCYFLTVIVLLDSDLWCG